MRFLLALTALCITFSASAHQLKTAVTTVLFNDRTHNIEVMHRFYLHDTEHAVGHLLDGHADILANPADQQRFADYVAGHVALKTLDGKPLDLAPVGYQVDGKFFWVYQETPIPQHELKGLKMSQGTLRDLWPTQVNMVNIEGKGKIRTLYFQNEEDWLTVKFDKN